MLSALSNDETFISLNTFDQIKMLVKEDMRNNVYPPRVEMVEKYRLHTLALDRRRADPKTLALKALEEKNMRYVPISHPDLGSNALAMA